MKAFMKTFHMHKHKQQVTEQVVPPPVEFTPSPWYKNEGDEYVMSFKVCASLSEKNSPVYKMMAKSFAVGSEAVHPLETRPLQDYQRAEHHQSSQQVHYG